MKRLVERFASHLLKDISSLSDIFALFFIRVLTPPAKAGIQKHLKLFFFILLSMLVTSCTHTKRAGDGPPPYPVDVSRIPNAMPKPEPLSKYNLPVYRVKGKVYRTLKSSKNYREVGVASWYGTLFHDRRTSSGERYNMLAMTAAHKTLPLPTYVEVRNLKNQRTVIVKVNDRGPFKDNRIIDLSYVAAKKLGMLGRGTAHVEVTAIDPYTFQKKILLAKNNEKNLLKSSKKNHPLYAAKKHHDRFIRVGTYKNARHATELKERISRAIKMPVIMTQNKQKQYLLQIGPLQTRDSEKAIKNRLKKHRIVT